MLYNCFNTYPRREETRRKEEEEERIKDYSRSQEEGEKKPGGLQGEKESEGVVGVRRSEKKGRKTKKKEK